MKLSEKIIIALIALAGTVFSVLWSSRSASSNDLEETIKQLNTNQREMASAVNDLRIEVAFLKGTIEGSKVRKLKLPEISINRSISKEVLAASEK
jgi:FtsZ-interacting cell division protein ZipA